MVVSSLETHTYGECKFEKLPQKMSEPWDRGQVIALY